MPYQIEFVEGSEKGVCYRLHPSVGAVLGRSPTSHIFVRERNTSRAHCQIQVGVDQCLIQDLNSTNGTYVDGERVTEAPLRVGNVVKIGRNIFRLVWAEDEGLSDRTQSMTGP